MPSLWVVEVKVSTILQVCVCAMSTLQPGVCLPHTKHTESLATRAR